MKISFFVEFPETDIEGLKEISFPTKLYIAAPSIQEFNMLKKQFKHKYVKEYIYWPTLKRSEGYWISPFSKRSALLRIINEIKEQGNQKVPVMIDAELPTTQNPTLYITQSLNFFRNRKLIKEFIKDYEQVYVAEYYPQGKFMTIIMNFLGLNFNPNKYNCTSIKMLYHSMHKFKEEFITKELTDGVSKFKNNYLIGLGLMYKGVEKEPKITLKQIKTDLSIAQKTGIKEVIIFRLSGLNKRYINLLKKYI